MGQQQLLLLVLGIVIVGLAVVVGIQAFADGAQQSEIDAVTMDVVRIASTAQAWAQKPVAFGGLGAVAGDASPFTDAATLNAIGLDTNASNEYVTANGSYTMTHAAGDLTITGTATNSSYTVTATVDGLTSADIATVVAAP